MKAYSNNDEVFIGKGAGLELLKDIKSAKGSVKVVSPYLSAGYIEDLIKKRKQNVNVMLITSDNLEEGDGHYSKLKHTDVIHQKRHVDEKARLRRSKGLRNCGFSLLLLVLYWRVPMSFVSQLFLTVVTASVIVGFFLRYYGMRVYTYDYFTDLDLKVFYSQYSKDSGRKGDHLIHSKVYVIDEKVAYVGSVNWTHSGVQKNYECIVKVKDPNAVKRISEEVDEIYNSDRLFKNVREWGQELYDEPPN